MENKLTTLFDAREKLFVENQKLQEQQKQKLAKQHQRDQLIKQEQLKEEQQKQVEQQTLAKLATLISEITQNNQFWGHKVRRKIVSNDNKPAGVYQIQSALKGIDASRSSTYIKSVLEQCVTIANHKYSAHFQWAHSFFRGRDTRTNNFYALLKYFDPYNPYSVNNLINKLEDFTGTACSSNQSISV